MDPKLETIDGVAVESQEVPGSADELAAVLRRASESASTVIPVGGGTQLGLGNPPRSAQVAVRTELLRGILEYEPDNMTISVAAGTTLRALQDALRERNQFLPLDPPDPERATIGGLVACNTSGPLRFRYGTIRDMLLGVKIAHADGTQTKAGGKLVKNVTGYDMCKLYTGSLGTLGILTELTFKVQPRSETLATAVLGYTSVGAALEAAQVFLRSDLLPDALEAWNGPAIQSVEAAAAESPWVLLVRFGEVEAAVQWQLARLEEVLAGTGGRMLARMGRDESEAFWQRAASARTAVAGEGAVGVKCSVLYRSAADTVREIEELAGKLGARAHVFCHAGNFVIYAVLAPGEKVPEAEGLRIGLGLLRTKCVAAGGHAVVEKARPDVKNGFDVWGYDAPALEIMRRIKNEFDPQGLLNPGRFVGGI